MNQYSTWCWVICNVLQCDRGAVASTGDRHTARLSSSRIFGCLDRETRLTFGVCMPNQFVRLKWKVERCSQRFETVKEEEKNRWPNSFFFGWNLIFSKMKARAHTHAHAFAVLKKNVLSDRLTRWRSSWWFPQLSKYVAQVQHNLRLFLIFFFWFYFASFQHK